MKFDDVVYCHEDLVRFIKEDFLIDKSKNKEMMTVSVTDGKKEYMIFLGKSSDDEYEVRVVKCEKNGNYVPNDSDEILRYEENDKVVKFYFDSFDKAHSFIDSLSYKHTEYIDRPTRLVKGEMKYPDN